MGLFGGGTQKVKTELPGYLEDPGKRIGYGIDYWLGNQFTGEYPLDPRSQEAIEMMEQQARNPAGFIKGGSSYLTNLYKTGGLTGQQRDVASSLAGGQYVNPAMAEAQRVALGGDVGRNPYLDATYNKAANVVGEQFRESVVPGMDTQFARSGRLGSGAYALMRNRQEEQLGRTLGDLATNVYGGAYEADRGRQQQALGMLGGLGQEAINNRIAGANIYQQGIGNQAQGIGLGGAQQQLRYSDINQLYQAGKLYQQAPADFYGQYANVIGQLQAPQTQTSSTQSNPLSSLLGVGLAGLSLFSDERLKTDIVQVGSIPVYEYRYKTDPKGTKRVGLMAHDVEKLRPAAVKTGPGGFKMVNYGDLT